MSRKKEESLIALTDVLSGGVVCSASLDTGDQSTTRVIVESTITLLLAISVDFASPITKWSVRSHVGQSDEFL